MAEEQEEKKQRKIPSWATRLPFGLCKRYGIALPDDATPREAWDALKGRGVSRQEVYESIREGAKPTRSDKGTKEEQRQESGKTVKAFMSNDRIRVTSEHKALLQKCFESGTPEMQGVTSRLFIEDSYSYVSHKGDGVFKPAMNAACIDYTKAYAEETFYHESWHAIDYNYGEISEEAIKNEYQPKINEIYLAARARSVSAKVLKETLEGYKAEMESKRYISCSHKLSTGKTFKETLLEETKGRGRALYEEISNKFFEDREKYGPQAARNKWSDMTDIINGLTNRQILSYHDRSYWDKAGNNRGKEAFAEIASSKATNQESYDIIKSYLPKTVEAFEELYGKISKGEIPRRQT